MKLRKLKWLAFLLMASAVLAESGFGQGKIGLQGRKAAKAEEAKTTEPQAGQEEDAPPDSPLENKVRQSQTAYAEQNYEESIKLATEVLNEDPRHGVARYQRASALIEIGRQTRDAKRIRAGIADAREALAVAGNQHLIFHVPYFYGLTSLAEVENRKTHAELGINIAGTLLQREDLPQDVRGLVYFQRGLAQAYMKNFKSAAVDFNSALEIDPAFQAAHFGKAEAYANAGDTAMARMAYDKAITAMPANPLAYNNRGSFRLQQSQIDLAIADFSKAVEIEPKFAMAYLNRGYAYSQKQAWSDAESNYAVSLSVDPDQPIVLRLLGMARVSQGKLAPAVEAFTNAIAKNPNDPENYSGRGFTKFFMRDYAGAAADFSKTLQLNPEVTMVVPWKYWAQVRSGQAAVAKADLQAFIKAKSKTPNWHVYLGQYSVGELDDQGLLSIAKNTKDLNAQKQWLCEAHFFQGLKSQQEGQVAAAKNYFTECLKTQQSQLNAYQGARLAILGK